MQHLGKPGDLFDCVPQGMPKIEDGAPPRFALLKDGQAVVGGTSRVETVRLDKSELSALKRRVDAARKAIGKSSRLALGEGGAVVRLRFPDEPPVEVALGLAPAPPPAPGGEPEPVAALVADVLSFRHPGLVPYEPPGYALVLREVLISRSASRG